MKNVNWDQLNKAFDWGIMQKDLIGQLDHDYIMVRLGEQFPEMDQEHVDAAAHNIRDYFIDMCIENAAQRRDEV